MTTAALWLIDNWLCLAIALMAGGKISISPYPRFYPMNLQQSVNRAGAA